MGDRQQFFFFFLASEDRLEPLSDFYFCLFHCREQSPSLSVPVILINMKECDEYPRYYRCHQAEGDACSCDSCLRGDLPSLWKAFPLTSCCVSETGREITPTTHKILPDVLTPLGSMQIGFT